MRTIDADDLKETFDVTVFNDYDDYKRALRIIDDAPTVHNPNCDICEDKAKQYSSGFQDGYMTGKERPKYEWDYFAEEVCGIRITGECPNCKQRRIIDNFCSSCGADMRGKEE